MSYIESMTDFEKAPPGPSSGRTYSLRRMLRLLDDLGNPHKQFKSVQIAGTKGKGSTAAMLYSMLRGNKLHVGLYTSPHLLDLRERIVVNDRMIPESDFARLTAKVANVARRMKNDPPTFFEVLTAVAFLYFASRKLDLAVVETGLGGRLDATSVLRPEACAITSISFDHMQQLGHTLAEIAEEKAGIFKPGVPAVSAPQVAEVKRTLKRMAAKVGCPLLFAGEDIDYSSRFESSRGAGPHTRICVTTPRSHYEHLTVPLLGEHQAVNCAIALGLLDQLKAKGLAIADEDAISGLANVSLPGRMELVHPMPRVLVDGAHNASSVGAVMRAIGQNVPYDSMVVIFGCNADKDVEGMLKLLALGADKLIFTRSTHPRAADPAELALRYKELTGRAEQYSQTLTGALAIAEKAVTREDLICITGSFYLVADVKRLAAKHLLFPQPALA
ncbi:MAG: bifunctional folylpolyglutamate synthase/dihydrofolate synthase [Phycisphaerae bacterium]|nr:bifunctional folylpolyglutamate synthase/dihydrofolate synthase [Phycisphaerae bacterium]